MNETFTEIKYTGKLNQMIIIYRSNFDYFPLTFYRFKMIQNNLF